MKKKLLIIYNRVWNYRIPIFELLAEEFDLTIAHCDRTETREFESFNTIFIDIWKIGPINFHKNQLHKLAKGFDVVIGLYGPKWLSLMLLLLRPNRKYKILLWGIGVSASYTKKFDTVRRWDWIRFYFARKADGILLYSDYALKKHLDNGVEREKIFIANNTVKVAGTATSIHIATKRNTFLFVGSLYRQKGIEILLEAFLLLLQKHQNIVLEIVGDGPEFNNIRAWINKKNLNSKIKLYGAIYNETLLAQHFHRAIACISPTQAGLSVLTSMAHGVPFVTSKNASTGGEVFNIIDGHNGFIFDGTTNSLYSIMGMLAENETLAKKVGKNAQVHYWSNRKPEQMAGAIIESVYYSLNK